jgi:hypothetical protein
MRDNRRISLNDVHRPALEELHVEAILVERRQMRFPSHEALGKARRFRQFDRAETSHPNATFASRGVVCCDIEMHVNVANHFLPCAKPKFGGKVSSVEYCLHNPLQMRTAAP